MTNTELEWKKFILNHSFEDIKNFLFSFPFSKRKDILHSLIFELLTSFGWHVELYENTLHLFERKNQEYPFLIISTSVNILPVNFNEIISTFNDLLSKSGRDKLTEQNYCFISLSGYEDDVYVLENFHMRLDDWDYIKNLIINYRSGSKNMIELLPHNQYTYRQIKDKWKKSKKIAAVQATGTGKTYLAVKCLSEFKDKQKLILAPSTTILEQYKQIMPDDVTNVFFITYQKLMTTTDEELRTFSFSLIVLDEFHRIGAEKWGTGVQRILEYCSDSYVLGLSATPIRYLDNARDMTKELFDGHIASTLTLEEAIVKRILPSPIYISALYSLDHEIDELLLKIDNTYQEPEAKKHKIEELNRIKLNWETSNGVSNIIKKHTMHYHNKFIVFMETKEQLFELKQNVVEWFEDSFPSKSIKTFVVWSGKTKEENKCDLELFSEECSDNTVKLLFCINMLNEGLHVKDVSGVLLLRKTISPTIYYQQIGRSLQTGKEKRPIIFDLVNNFKEVNVNFFLQNIEEVAEKEKYERDKFGLPFELPDFTVIDEIQHIEKVFDEIESRLVHDWAFYYHLLIEYKNKFGNCLVPTSYIVNGKRLGNWVSAQRTLYNKGLLSNERIAHLNEVGFVWDLLEFNWNKSYQLLKEFFEKNGHCRVPSKYTVDNVNLESWSYSQKRSYKLGRLPNDKIDKLLEINFMFYPNDQIWLDMFQILLEFKNQYHHLMVPRNYEVNGKRLGTWVEYQRWLYNNNKLKAERAKMLNQIGFIWDYNSAKWNQMFETLKEFKKRNGHCMVPANFKHEDKNLGVWVSEQRSIYKKNQLSIERIESLNSIGFIWDPIQHNWDYMYQLLSQFKVKYGHLNVPGNKFYLNENLGNWVSVQRQFYKKEQLSSDRIEKLNELGFSWNPFEEKWNQYFSLLKEYYQKNGDFNVPYKYIIDGKKLGQWLSSQRRYYKRGELSEERIIRFKNINLHFDND